PAGTDPLGIFFFGLALAQFLDCPSWGTFAGLAFGALAIIPFIPSLAEVELLADALEAEAAEGDFVNVFHGSINDASTIASEGLDPARGTAFVSRDLEAAMDAIGPNRYEVANGLARDPGIIQSQ